MSSDVQPFLAATLACLLATWLWIRRSRCCGQPDSCSRLAPGSEFLNRCGESPQCAKRCAYALPTLAMCRLREGAVGHAMAAAARAVEAGNPGARLVLARIHDQLGNGRFARTLLRQEVAVKGLAMEAWLALGDHLAKSGDYAEALLNYRRAAECDPSFAEAWCAMGRCYAALDDWEDAKACFEVALQRHPGDLPTLHSLGLVLVGAGETAEAIKLFERIMDITGPTGPLLARLGRLARDTGDYRRAVVLLKDAMRLSGMPEVKRDMSELYEAMGQGEIAEFYRQEFEREYVV